MIIYRKHWRWAVWMSGTTLVLGLLYLANFRPDIFPLPLPSFMGPRPPLRGSTGSTPLGLFYGSVAFFIFIFAALLGARRARPAARVGRVRTWLKAHIWFSVLTIPLVLMHSGFALGGPMTRLLMWLYGIVMISGFFGTALQNFVPRLMKDHVPMETIFEQIPHIRRQLHTQASELRKTLDPLVVAQPAGAGPSPEAAAAHEEMTGDGPIHALLRDMMDQEILPYLSAERGDRMRLGNPYTAELFFHSLKLNLPPKHHPTLERCQVWVDERRQLDLQTKLHHWLHGWLLIHAPVSVLLLIVTAWHAIVAVFKY